MFVAMVVTSAIAQLAVPSAQQAPAAPDPNDIMGFESLGTWNVTASSGPPGFTAVSTTTRTQGNAAYQVSNPPNLIKLISQPIASTATALTGIGNAGGSLLQIDVFIPAQQGNEVNHGYIQPYITSRSRGLSKVPLAQGSFSGYRPGIYNTIGFAIPDAVNSALSGGTFNDLVFEFDVSSPGKMTGAYLFDNLRIHSLTMVQSPTGQAPPPGYGGSVNLTVSGNDPVTQSFNLGPTQIPGRVYLKYGITNATITKFQLGLDGQATLTCTYDPDGPDTSGRSYILNSCTGGFEAGDLVNANWVHVEIIGGDSTQEIRAQLAMNPLGDLTGAGLLPAMPTFWGDPDQCTPKPLPGIVVTTSKSCSDQVNQANQIITNYFNQVQSANPAPNWIVPPVADFATRHGDGTPTNNVPGGPPPTPGDPLFDDSGDLNPGGTFDAYWKLSGNLTPTAVPNTDEDKTHFDGTFTAHSVIFGDDVDVLDAKLTADTDSGQTTPSSVAASSSGTLAFYVFGNELPSGGLSLNPSTGFSKDLTWSQEYDLPPITIWIFDLNLGATVNAELKASASAAISGLDLSLTPSTSLGTHVSGGIDIGVASGSVDAKVNLVQVSLPVTAQAKWVINTDPKLCAATLNGSLKGDLNLSSGGGEVDLDATFGDCPFCYTDSETLFKWGPLASTDWQLFNDTIDTQLFGLPASMCSFPITVNIISPSSGANLSSGLAATLQGSAKPNDTSIPATTTYTWTFTPGANASTATVTGGATATPTVTFGQPTSGLTSTWTIGLSATVTVNSAGGTQLTSTASATPVDITVSNLSNGVYISQLVGTDGTALSANGFVLISDPAFFLNPGGGFTVDGLVAGTSGTLNSEFSVAMCTDGTSACTAPGPAAVVTTANATSATPTAFFQGGSFAIGNYYLIKMTTTSNGNPYGSASVVIFDNIIQ